MERKLDMFRQLSVTMLLFVWRPAGTPLSVVLSPPRDESISILEVAAGLAVCAVRRKGRQAGNAIIFVPGLQEILRLRELIKGAEKNVCVWLLHSDIVGTDQEEDQELADPRTAPLIALSTILGATAVTLPNIRYVFCTRI